MDNCFGFPPVDQTKQDSNLPFVVSSGTTDEIYKRFIPLFAFVIFCLTAYRLHHGLSATVPKAKILSSLFGSTYFTMMPRALRVLKIYPGVHRAPGKTRISIRL
jgi:hypothetical protein